MYGEGRCVYNSPPGTDGAQDGCMPLIHVEDSLTIRYAILPFAFWRKSSWCVGSGGPHEPPRMEPERAAAPPVSAPLRDHVPRGQGARVPLGPLGFYAGSRSGGRRGQQTPLHTCSDDRVIR